MKYKKIVRHPFDVVCGDMVTEQQGREITKRYHDFTRWCEESATKEYAIDQVFKAEGIIVEFESLRDCKAFTKYADEYWIFLHE